MPRGLDLTDLGPLPLFCEHCKSNVYGDLTSHTCPPKPESIEQQMLAELKHISATLDKIVGLLVQEDVPAGGG